MKITILGLNAYHGDSSACLVIDGQLIAAAASSTGQAFPKNTEYLHDHC